MDVNVKKQTFLLKKKNRNILQVFKMFPTVSKETDRRGQRGEQTCFKMPNSYFFVKVSIYET